MSPRKGVDALRGRSEAQARRQAVHSHNACFGGVAQAKVWMRVIQEKPTVTVEAKVTAWKIEGLLLQLSEQLKTRKEQQS